MSREAGEDGERAGEPRELERPGSGKRTFLVLMGAPGAGKGTQADRLAAALKLCKLSTGDLLRDALRRGTDLGRAAESRMREGTLVEDEIILGLVREELEQVRCAGGAVLDGFPRTLGQAGGLDELLAELGESLRRVIFIDVDEGEIVRRLSSRRICESCGRIQGGDAGCAACGGRLVQRPDDRPETVLRRLEVFREQTAPLLERYRSRALLGEVDGGGDVARIHERVLQEAT